MQLKHLILVALCVSASIAATTPKVACTNETNALVTKGVCQWCHPSCKTCTGSGSDKCATCNGDQTEQSGACACPATTGNGIVSATVDEQTTLTCATTGKAANKCPQDLGWGYVTTACTRAPWTYKKTKDDALKPAANATGSCWAGVDCDGSGDCKYINTASYILGVDAPFDSTQNTVTGYYLDGTTFEFKPCKMGCAVCTSGTDCTGCFGEYKPVSNDCTCGPDLAWAKTTTTCVANLANCKTQTEDLKCATCAADHTANADKTECVADTTTTTTTTTIASDTPADGCAADAWGCTKCDDKKVCSACNTTNHWKLNATTVKCECAANYVGSSKENCGLACKACATGEVASLDTATTKCKCIAGTTATATATTSGMLLTVASMVMAVILA